MNIQDQEREAKFFAEAQVGSLPPPVAQRVAPTIKEERCVRSCHSTLRRYQWYEPQGNLGLKNLTARRGESTYQRQRRVEREAPSALSRSESGKGATRAPLIDRSENFEIDLTAPTRRWGLLFGNPRSLLTVERAFQLPEPLKRHDPPASLSFAERKMKPSGWEKVKDFFWDLGSTLKGVLERRPWQPKRL